MLEVINDPILPYTPAQLERAYAKVVKSYPLPEDRLTFKPEEWDERVAAREIDIPDGPWNLADHPGVSKESVHLCDPIHSKDSPMEPALMAVWRNQPVLKDEYGEPILDTANRPLHARAGQLLTTIGMYTGLGSYRYYGPMNRPVNIAWRCERDGEAYYPVVGVYRDEGERLRLGLPAGYAEKGDDGTMESDLVAGLREFGEETGVDPYAFGLQAVRHVITAPHGMWKDTLHACMSERYIFVRSQENPGLYGVELQTRAPQEVKFTQLMSYSEIQAHPDFLGSHRQQIERYEASLQAAKRY